MADSKELKEAHDRIVKFFGDDPEIDAMLDGDNNPYRDILESILDRKAKESKENEDG